MIDLHPIASSLISTHLSFRIVTKFRPCIDLHQGKVKQIVGGSLTKDNAELKTNFTSDRPAAEFAKLYAKDGLTGGHLIMLGPENEVAALKAIQAFPNGLQVGGGISLDNAKMWIEQGASHIIVTSCLFNKDAQFVLSKLQDLVERVGKDKIVIDLSCKRRESDWLVMKDNWQTETDLSLTESLLEMLSDYCAEFLIHATDLEGKCQGIDRALVEFLGKHSPLPVTYAGGVQSLSDLETVKSISSGKVDVTIGSGLDMFGGTLVKYKDCISWNNRN